MGTQPGSPQAGVTSGQATQQVRGPGTELLPSADGPPWASAPRPALGTVVGGCGASSRLCHTPVGQLYAVASSLQVPLPPCEVGLLGCSLDSPRVSPGDVWPWPVPVGPNSGGPGPCPPHPRTQDVRGREGRREAAPVLGNAPSCPASDRPAGHVSTSEAAPALRPCTLKPWGTALCHVT